MVAWLCPGYFSPFIVGSRFLALLQIIAVLPRKGSLMLGKTTLSEGLCGLCLCEATIPLDS